MHPAIAVVLLLLAGVVIYAYACGPRLPPGTDAIIEDVLHGELPEVIMGQTGIATSGGLDIWYESILPNGSSKGAVLLLMANGGDALLWPPSFVRALVNAGYQVIRYDQRGTGMSDWVTDWSRKSPYTLTHLSSDAIAVLDALEIQEAHLVGLSMGGMVAQEVAIHHHNRVLSLALLMTSGYIGDPDLPGMSSRYFWSSMLKGIPLLKYRMLGGEKNLIRERIAKTIATVGSEGVDVGELAELVLYDLRERRGINIRAAFQHATAVAIAGSRYDKLRTLNVPTLVVHGTNDRVIPIEHGKRLVEVIPHARGLWFYGVGHVFPVPDMNILVKNIILNIELCKQI